MKVAVILTLVARAAAGGATMREQADCVFDSAEAVSDALDASMFLWAATKRCGAPNLPGVPNAALKCEIDVASATKAANSMINVILSAVHKCKGLEGSECGMQAGKLTEHLAGAAAASGQVVERCTAAANQQVAGLAPTLNSPVLCTVDIKNTAKSLFEVVKNLQNVKKECRAADKSDCAANALNTIASFSGMGQFVAGTLGQCQKQTKLTLTPAQIKTDMCAQASLAAGEYAVKIAEDGVKLAKFCQRELIIVEEQKGLSRLYGEEPKKRDGAINLTLGAFLPVIAIAAFVTGKLYARRRARMEHVHSFIGEAEE